MIGPLIRLLTTSGRRVSARLRGHVVAEVSEHSAVCEFDCSKLECRHAHWDRCARRVANVTGGETGTLNR